MPIEQNYLAPSHETLETYFTFLIKYTQLNRPLRDVIRHCIAKKYALSTEKALVLVYLHAKVSDRSCSIHHIIANHWYGGLNPSYILKKLSEHGLIEKKCHEEDRRKIVVTLSALGRTVAYEIQCRMEYLLDQRPGLIQSLSHSIQSVEQLINFLP
ncbi:transcriptional regulator, SarA/Rot family [Holospora curviuscula]|uniref:HTH marR-type domain-containing protein n=1 Tax=Holospora curviuscula TaxID=1082868 RepID=A0A2S5RE66_9PROT|nr:winged helix DNA-binding protein [Holospora curviuscula]PPE05616.1 hypothetical protein HCUR_00264 [Holospora curviuscula]